MADVETGIGPFVATYLSASHHLNPAQIGIVLGSQSLAEVIAQPPAGWLIDRVRGKKWLIAAAAVVISVGALFIVSISSVSGQIANQVAIGIAAAFVSPTVNAISLGLVGRPAFARRVGRNGAFSHGGNLTSALVAGFLGYAIGQQWIFYGSAILGAVVLASISFIRERDIDHDAARELSNRGDESRYVYSLNDAFKRTRILLFAAIVAVFHFANAAILPLAGQELAKIEQGASAIYMSACIVVAQAVMVPVSYSVGRVADSIGRKPIFLAAFGVVAARGLFFAFGQRPLYIVGTEALDGVGTAIASVLAVLVVSDLAQGTGRFNLMQGAIQAAVGIGAFLGNSAAGLIASQPGFRLPSASSLALPSSAFCFMRCACQKPKESQSTETRKRASQSNTEAVVEPQSAARLVFDGQHQVFARLDPRHSVFRPPYSQPGSTVRGGRGYVQPPLSLISSQRCDIFRLGPIPDVNSGQGLPTSVLATELAGRHHFQRADMDASSRQSRLSLPHVKEDKIKVDSIKPIYFDDIMWRIEQVTPAVLFSTALMM